MFNNRMLAVAAVLVMAVPALGAATPIVVPPEAEQLVEGHTVFTVIEIARARNTTTTHFAAAVAVLVQEYNAQYRNNRFPGVLWFNDQYLVNPEQSQRNEAAIRYPCGGAVMAVNAGDPDPRMTMFQDQTLAAAPVTGLVEIFDETLADDGPKDASIGTNEYNYPPYYAYGNDFSQVGIDAAGTPYSDTLPTTADYEKSYLITDPNDHSWIIDVYTTYTRTTVVASVDTTDPTQSVLTTEEVVYESRVWVVNIGGAAVFTPDMDTGLNCPPFEDFISSVLDSPPVEADGTNRADTNQAGTVTCNEFDPDLDQDGNSATSIAGESPIGVAGTPTARISPTVDEPCAGYADPGTNGYCYQGEPGTTAAACAAKAPRIYNALLYFELADLTVAGQCKDHDTGSWNGDPTCGAATWQNAAGQTGVTDKTNPADTNGCHDSASGNWDCAPNTDNAEGNSHPFHPVAHPFGDVEPCQAYIGGPNANNHGGSAYMDAFYGLGEGSRANPTEWTPCDNFHATRDIDVYFSGAGRPWEPLRRDFVEQDTQGSEAPFYQGTH